MLRNMNTIDLYIISEQGIVMSLQHAACTSCSMEGLAYVNLSKVVDEYVQGFPCVFCGEETIRIIQDGA